METFEIRDEFHLNGKPFKVISGAMHYFRVVPEYWRDRLEKLRLLGCNTVETYIPWNMHEPHEGEFDFEGRLNVRSFIQIAQEVGLYVILRPSPYICAEWEFGGLPYWLLQDPQMKLRFEYTPYLEKVDHYFERLMQEFVDLQIMDCGPILMMQVENEYGSYANDKGYLRKVAKMMRDYGVQVPLVTSDGPWADMLENGTIPELALATMNCGSDIKENYEILKDFHGEKKPLMVMEFWIGWFDAWGDPGHHQTNIEDAAKELDDILEQGSVNIYMFHGGTNFGFTSGANYYADYAPQVTSYDYDALLSEWGEPTPKYDAFQKVISKYTEIPTFELSTTIKKKAYGEVKISEKVSLFESLEDISEKVQSPYPLSMEDLDQGTGYVYYQSNIGKKRKVEDFKLISTRDRANIYVNEKLLFTQYDHEIGKEVSFDLMDEENNLGILVENMGRINYSVKMNHQHKGIKDGVVINRAFQSGWDMYSLPMDNLEKLNFEKDWQKGTPSFYRATFQVDEVGDTFIELDGWGKGFVLVNGMNIGRFWEVGPQKRLYIPGPLLEIGKNELIIFESDGKATGSISLLDEPDLGVLQKK
ncbi:beta-galactosidase [Jeotgalibaca sp. MA1X17-3]|uniref:glycoside hydrolase family 35 protein n=1 Tax=Jeotgalibaca sp. MA1X17-3 TaxID=2908211 RepID=UPI001F4233F0|nr:beta-galactosidase family protein [Jeotgalibaca sp. MA1X17-3]UJF16642.1 beta-galactosidase [Jeotgalibaca sp. MA1X17-3]